jgi:hypothetical protein
MFELLGALMELIRTFLRRDEEALGGSRAGLWGAAATWSRCFRKHPLGAFGGLCFSQTG